jgi:hypothetical protein
MNKNQTFICNGDSWVFGSEIIDPTQQKNLANGKHVTTIDYLPDNDAYRCPRIFSSYMAEIADATSINISWPADDNTTILYRTMDYVTNTYLSQGKSTENLMIIIGWSSPERNSFWYDDGQLSILFRLWPNVQHFDSDLQKKFWDIYTRCMWNSQEYIRRYVHTIINFQNWCVANNLKWLCFNSFQQVRDLNINEWQDLNVRNEIEALTNKLGGYQYHSSDEGNVRNNAPYNLMPLWDQVDNVRFYKKDQENNTFKSFITEHNKTNTFNGWHPSPESHKIWAQELWSYIKENKLD